MRPLTEAKTSSSALGRSIHAQLCAAVLVNPTVERPTDALVSVALGAVPSFLRLSVKVRSPDFLMIRFLNARY
eukprot:4218557-Prymnesium_polylepis.1